MQGSKVGTSYDVKSPDEARQAYDVWANDYESDLLAMGYRLPWVFAATCVRYLDRNSGRILDLGAGGGMQVEPLKLLGFDTIEAADISLEMMNVARAKGLYSAYHQITPGALLPFADRCFTATLACGVITPGHAPPEALDDLVRVTSPGGRIIFSMRDDAEQLPEYPAKLRALQNNSTVTEIFRTDAFASLPTGEPDVRHRVHVCEVLK